MRDEHMIQRQGKQYVLYVGLLDEAHKKFDRLEIETSLHSLEPVPVVTAKVRGYDFKKSMETPAVKTSGIGTGQRKSDRSGAAADAPIEMAETRAKARALRDAVNVGATSLEELSDDAEPQQQRQQKPRPTPEESGAVRGGAVGSTGELERVPEEAISNIEAAQRMTRDQKDQLNTLIKLRSEQTGNSEEDIRAALEGNLGFELEDLTRGEAIEIIQMLHKRAEEHEEKERAS